jgi:hypothetical protein
VEEEPFDEFKLTARERVDERGCGECVLLEIPLDLTLDISFGNVRQVGGVELLEESADRCADVLFVALAEKREKFGEGNADDAFVSEVCEVRRCPPDSRELYWRWYAFEQAECRGLVLVLLFDRRRAREFEDRFTAVHDVHATVPALVYIRDVAIGADVTADQRLFVHGWQSRGEREISFHFP